MHRRRVARLLVLLSLAVEISATWRRGYGLGGRIEVECRDGHHFTTLWIPGVSLTSLRLGWWRLQRCPVGHHWSLITPAPKDG